MKDNEAGKCVYEVQLFNEYGGKVSMGFFVDFELANTYKASLMRRFPLTGITVKNHTLIKCMSDINKFDKGFS